MSKPVITDSLEFPSDSNIIRYAYVLGAVGIIASIVGVHF